MGPLMLSPSPTQAGRWVCWVTAASLLVSLVEATLSTNSARPPRLGITQSPAAREPPPPSLFTRSAVNGADRASVLFVVGPTRDVRFRVDLRDGTVATPRMSRVLERVVDVALSEHAVFLCQAGAEARIAPRVVGFDLRTGERSEAALVSSGAAALDPGFCEGRRTPVALTLEGYSTALQMSLERQATILPKVSNGDLQSSFLISSRHSLSSLTTMPPGQS